MNREKMLAKSTIILGMGTLVPQLVNYLTIPILTKYLTTNDYGLYDLLLSMAVFLLPAMTLQIQAAGFRFLIVSRDDLEKCRKIISSLLFFVTLVSAGVLFFLSFFLPVGSVGIKLLIGFYLFLDVLYTCVGSVLRGLGQNFGYAVGAFVLSVVKAALITVFVAVRRQALPGIISALVLAYLAAVLFMIIKNHLYRYVRIKAISLAEIKQLLTYSWPMVPNNLSTWALNMSDRWVITYFLGASVNAVYAAANNITNIVNGARSVLIMAWQENASLAAQDADAEVYFTRMYRAIFSMIVGITAFLIGVTPILFRILIRGDYAAAYPQIPILFIGVFFGCISSLQGGIYIAHMKTKDVGLSALICAGINLFLDILLVNKIGIYAGSISTVVSYFILFLYRLTWRDGLWDICFGRYVRPVCISESVYQCFKLYFGLCNCRYIEQGFDKICHRRNQKKGGRS